MFRYTQLDCWQTMLKRLYKKELEQVVLWFEEYRSALSDELDRQEEIMHQQHLTQQQQQQYQFNLHKQHEQQQVQKRLQQENHQYSQQQQREQQKYQQSQQPQMSSRQQSTETQQQRTNQTTNLQYTHLGKSPSPYDQNSRKNLKEWKHWE